ncbi:MAG: hypothetical protein H7062_20005 [Candidatus Saccharimonas sp.]|nr:hypothetical protein [Planctomycetaceae bacterium]
MMPLIAGQTVGLLPRVAMHWNDAVGHYRCMLTASGRSVTDVDAALQDLIGE